MSAKFPPNPDAGPLPASPRSKRRNAVITVTLLFVTSLLVSGLFGFATGYLEQKAPPVWVLVAAVVGIGVSITVTVLLAQQTLRYWRTIDELARRAHTDSWFWGGSIGMGFGLAIAIAAGTLKDLTPLHAWITRLTPADALVVGGVSVAGAALLGYCIWWAGFWLAQR